MKLIQLVEINSLDINHFDSLISYKVEVVAIYLDKDSEEIWEEDLDYIDYHYTIVQKILTSTTTFQPIILLNNTEFRKIEYGKLSIGEYIDLDYYLSKNDILKALMIIYRRFKQKSIFDEIKYEKYSNYFDIREEFFLDLEVDKVLGVINDYIKWREQLLVNYKGLFNTDSEDDEEDGVISNISVKQAKHRAEQEATFSWERLILSVADGDFTKVKEIFQLPVLLFFNLLSTKKVFNI